MNHYEETENTLSYRSVEIRKDSDKRYSIYIGHSHYNQVHKRYLKGDLIRLANDILWMSENLDILTSKVGRK